MSKFTLKIIPILLFSLSGCTPLMSVPHFESIDPALLDNFDKDQKTQEGTIFTLAITELNLDDDTDLGPAFSELYLGDFLGDKVQSYISIQDFMYGGNQDKILITLDPKVIGHSDSVDVCLISGKPESNNFNVKNKWDCKSFRVSELIEMRENGYEFNLKSASDKIPKLDMLIYPQS